MFPRVFITLTNSYLKIYTYIKPAQNDGVYCRTNFMTTKLFYSKSGLLFGLQYNEKEKWLEQLDLIQ